MLPSLYASGDAARAWSLARAAAYGAGIGALAALVKIFGLRQGGATAAPFWDVAEAAVAFALLCAGLPPCAISSHGGRSGRKPMTRAADFARNEPAPRAANFRYPIERNETVERDGRFGTARKRPAVAERFRPENAGRRHGRRPCLP